MYLLENLSFKKHFTLAKKNYIFYFFQLLFLITKRNLSNKNQVFAYFIFIKHQLSN